MTGTGASLVVAGFLTGISSPTALGQLQERSDRKSVVEGKGVGLGGWLMIRKQNKEKGRTRYGGRRMGVEKDEGCWWWLGFVMLLVNNRVQAWSRRRFGDGS